MQQQKMRRSASAALASLALFGSAAAVAVLVDSAAPQTAYAQVPFRVTRPESGATVRETVRFQIARRSIPADAKYLSLNIDGRLRGGIFIPPPDPKGLAVRSSQIQANNSTIFLLWDTKALDNTPNLQPEQRVVQDGSHTIEIGVHDANGKRIASQTVTVNVNNRGTLPSPAGGVLLTYNFRVGQDRYYRQRTEVEYIGEQQAAAPVMRQGGNSGYQSRGAGQGGGQFPGGGGGGEFEGGPPPGFGGPGFGGGFRGGPPGGFGGPGGPGVPPSGPFNVPVQVVTANYERSIEDNLGANQFFVRDKVMDGVIIGGNGNAARLEDVYNFKSRYRTVLESGFVKEYGVASMTRPGAYIALPIVNLGGRRRRVGEEWTSKAPVLLEWATLDKPPMLTVRNKLETLEWQDNRQTARIKQTYEGKASIPIFGGAGTMKDADVKMERTIWFGFKTGDIIRMETNTEVSGNAPANVLQQMVPQAGISAGGAGMGGMGMGGGEFGERGGGAPFGPGGGAFGPGGPGAPGFGGIGGIGAGQAGAGFGAQQAAPLAPAKFRSKTTISLAPARPKAASQTASR